MSTVLVLNSSATGDASVSRVVVNDAVARLQAHDPDLVVLHRNIGENPIPHLSPDAAVALQGRQPTKEHQANVLALSDELIGELQRADTIIIGAPMYNFGIPSTLKSWFDHVLRAGVTFRYSEAGPEGLLKGKRAVVVLARGGFYSEGPAQAMDAQEPHLRTLLAFIGIADVTFVRVERLAFGPEAREQSINQAMVEIGRVTEEVLRRAA
jgi:FMN-dependent NADH-azoreductase